MGYRVDYRELDMLYEKVVQSTNDWKAGLNQISGRVLEIAGSDSITGKGADNIKEYLRSVHARIQTSLERLMMTHRGKCLLYKSDYQNTVDTAMWAYLEEEEMIGMRNYLRIKKAQIEAVNRKVNDSIREVADICSIRSVSIAGIEIVCEEIDKKITELDRKAVDTEIKHSTLDYPETDALVVELSAFIQDLLSKSRDYKLNFDRSSLKIDSLTEAEEVVSVQWSKRRKIVATALEIEQRRVQIIENEQRIIELREAERIRLEELEAAARAEREENTKLVNNVVMGACFVASIAIVVGTAGMASPIAAGIVTVGSAATLGAVEAGVKTVGKQYVESGEVKPTDWSEVGKDAFVAGKKEMIVSVLTLGTSKLIGAISIIDKGLKSTSKLERVTTAMGKALITTLSGTVEKTTLVMINNDDLTFKEAYAEANSVKAVLISAGVGMITGGIKASKAVNTDLAADKVAKKVADETTESAVEDATEKVAEKTARSAAESAATKAVKDAVDSAKESVTTKSVSDTVKSAAESVATKGLKETAKSAAEDAAGKAVKNAVNSVKESVTTKSVSDTVKSVVGNAAKEGLNDAVKSVVGDVATKGLKDTAKSAAEKVATKAVKSAVESVTNKAVKETAESAANRVVVGVASSLINSVGIAASKTITAKTNDKELTLKEAFIKANPVENLIIDAGTDMFNEGVKESGLLKDTTKFDKAKQEEMLGAATINVGKLIKKIVKNDKETSEDVSATEESLVLEKVGVK